MEGNIVVVLEKTKLE